jgi:hypothetical protein
MVDGLWFYSLWFMIYVLWFMVCGVWFMVLNLEFGIEGVGLRGFRV